MTYNHPANINATEAPAHFVPYNNTDDIWKGNWTQQEVDSGLPHGPPFSPPTPTQEELMLQVYIKYFLMFQYILANNPKYQRTK